MEYNLLKIAKLSIDEKQKLATNKGISINDKIYQTGFKFEESPKIIIVKDIQTLTPVQDYHHLNEIFLTDEEKQIVQETEKEIIQKGGYNGDVFLVKGIIYNENKNELYLEAVQAKYALITSLSSKKFSDKSKLYKIPLYKAGVFIPSITKDENIIFMERTRDKFYASTAGFLEVKENDSNLDNIVLKTAKDELEEELFGDNTNPQRNEFLKQFINENIPVKGISIRKTKRNPIGSIEFIAENKINLDIDYLKYLTKNNTAKDSKEHTEKHFAISLYPQDRTQAIKELIKNYSGWFLYGAILDIITGKDISSIILNRPGQMIFTKALKAQPQKNLKWTSQFPPKRKIYMDICREAGKTKRFLPDFKKGFLL